MKRKTRLKTRSEATGLFTETEVRVRFGEVDSMGIVWHGNYANYLEDGRDHFGDEYNFNLVKIFERHGFLTPIVNMNLDYKLPLKYGDTLRIETRFVDCDAARIQFEYKLFRAEDNKLLTVAETRQVFTTADGILQLTNPDFYIEWKKKWGIA
ncbi:acyl-CoA thioesterase [bacterium]|nr:acyl-CoA thioesterase [bacterium]